MKLFKLINFTKSYDLIWLVITPFVPLLIFYRIIIGKEEILKNLTSMLKDDLLDIPRHSFVEGIMPQLQSSNLEAKYKNTLLKLLVYALPKSPLPALFELLIAQLAIALEKVVSNSQASLL